MDYIDRLSAQIVFPQHQNPISAKIPGTKPFSAFKNPARGGISQSESQNELQEALSRVLPT